MSTLRISKSTILTTLAICFSIIGVSSESGVGARKENNAISVAAYGSDKNIIDTQPVRCSICNSMSPKGLSDVEVRRIGAVGQDCITNPEKFVQSCDQWRSDYGFDHPLNKSVRFTGCYKTVFTYEHDIEGNDKDEERVVRSCGFLGTPGCFRAPGHGTTQRICFCQGPECNGSGGLIPGFIILISLALSSILLRL
ncbi:uncharacterized protein LOC128393132 [Panonychus citri]|uniref:uncharacterized protein LOC128393132 n=1 Tax=Panonychus citri TaxID=50023 RepID=UPI0023074593|nr:uncharacterized protein LOC128393132 [Panonychus citri]XP_053209234.1 uncharacterized protein LOC128393132 [Panonychus citri]